ncbi:hypothetical protein [Methylomonas fluvii]|uniref:Uncharacterized protein n=1 Tax=Methylomonas fluvii TaxID=1854564 RepID=A0ABR9DCC4_9GAMM|nr:hypothetical protein [Methylomonas fluvii]MBD9360765.1 hypothetical protein [Methylomonas fluvii]
MILEASIQVDLPVQAEELALQVRDFKVASRSGKKQTAWFFRCVNSPSFVRWNNRELIGRRLNEVEFAAVAARSYSALFELSKEDIPRCPPSLVAKKSSQAARLLDAMPHSTLLPGYAKEDVFLKGLADLSKWTAESIPSGFNGKGKPALRWLIAKIAEEFCYSFSMPPSVAIIGDLVRIGWPAVEDRSIRNTANDEMLTRVIEVAALRRIHDNNSKTISHQVISAFSSKKEPAPLNQSTPEIQTSKPTGDCEILELMEKQAKALTDSSDRRRLISIINAIRYENGYMSDNEGN